MKTLAPRVKRWSPRSPLEALIATDTLLAELTPRYGEAIDNLDQLQPGISGTPAGNGEPGGGSRFSATSVVERTAQRTAEHGIPAEARRLAELTAYPVNIEAAARAVLARLDARPTQLPTRASASQRLTWVAWVTRICADIHRQTNIRLPHSPVERLYTLVCNLHDLIFTIVEPRPNTQRSAELVTDTTEMWCRSCLRVGQREPRSERYAGLCRWCGDLQATAGFLPTLNLLDAHHEGRRITLAMITAEKPRKKRKRK